MTSMITKYLRAYGPLIAILLFSLAMRLYKLDSNMPHFYWHDENNFVEVALRFGTGNMKPPSIQHGMLLPLILFTEYALYFAAKVFAGAYHAPADMLREYLTDPSVFYIIARLTVLAFGMGCILLVFLIARKLYNALVANLAALLYSVTLLPFIASKWTKEDLVASFFLLLGFLICASLPAGGKRPAMRYYACAGFCIGLAAAAKYSACFGVIFVVVMHLYAHKPAGTGGKLYGYLRSLFDTKLFVCAGFFIAGFFVGNPYALINPRFFYGDVARMHREMVDPNIVSWRLYFTDHLRDAIGGRFLEVIALVSAAYFLAKRSRSVVLLLSYPVTFYLFYLNYPGIAHYLIPLVPFLLIVAAAFFGGILSGRPRPVVRLAAILAISMAVTPCALNMFRYNVLIAAPDTRTLSLKWIEENLPADARILSEGYISTLAVHVPPLRGNMKTLMADRDAIRVKEGSCRIIDEEIKLAGAPSSHRRYDIYKMREADAGLIRQERPEYVVLTGYHDMKLAQRESYQDPDYGKKRSAMYAALDKEYRLLKEFDPYPEFSSFFPMLLIGDFDKIEKIDLLRGSGGLFQGPRISIFIRKG